MDAGDAGGEIVDDDAGAVAAAHEDVVVHDDEEYGAGHNTETGAEDY